MAEAGLEARKQQQDGGGYVTFTPSRAQVFWRRLGFRYHLGEHEKDIDWAKGAIDTTTGVRLGFLDRLRILASGHLRVRTVMYTDANVQKTAERVDWEIVEPGGVR